MQVEFSDLMNSTNKTSVKASVYSILRIRFHLIRVKLSSQYDLKTFRFTILAIQFYKAIL